jgi:hypothetical protein
MRSETIESLFSKNNTELTVHYRQFEHLVLAGSELICMYLLPHPQWVRSTEFISEIRSVSAAWIVVGR